MRTMQRVFLVMAAILSLGLIAAPSWAANAHIVKGPNVTFSGNTLSVTASIAGLGNVPSAQFSLEGTVDLFSRCYNKGGNKPQAANKQETLSVNESATFPVRNGRTNVSFSIPLASTLTCPGNQVVVVESASWDLTLSGQGLSEPIQGSL